MSERLTVGDLKTSRIPAALTICPDDPRFLQWLNEAESLMLNQGRWFGSVREARFCVTDGCLVWPREVAVVEQIALCGQPLTIQNQWYQFTRTLAHVHGCVSCGGDDANRRRGLGGGCGHLQMTNGNTVASFSMTQGNNKTIRTYTMDPSDVGKKIIYQGYDLNGTWVRTKVSGVWIDGEQVTLAIPFADTVTVWNPGNPIAVQKDKTNQRLLVYEHDTDTDKDRSIAVYQPSETAPQYQSSVLPNIRRASRCCGGSCNVNMQVTALVSLQHLPLENDGDWLLFQNLSAYKAAMQAVQAWEMGDAAKGDFYFYGTQNSPSNGRNGYRVINRGGAIPLLQAELRKMTGDRTAMYVTLDETNSLPRVMAGFI